VKWRPIVIAGLAVAAVAGLVIWLQHARLVGHWFQVHTGTINEPGPYYGFWSGFGSDLEEFGILGAVGAGLYSLVRKYNCHEPGCWRVGTHPARRAASSTSVTATTRTSRARSQPMSSSSDCTVSTWSARLPSTADSRRSIRT
jgi:hypothetical protein